MRKASPARIGLERIVPHLTRWACVLACALLNRAAYTASTAQSPEGDAPVRELHVPYEELHWLLGTGEDRVLLDRSAFEALKQKAKVRESEKAPHAALFTEAAYQLDCARDSARIKGTLGINVLEDGIHAIPLPFSHLLLREARLDDDAAPIGMDANGQALLFVEGVGTHVLSLEALTPLKTTAARQIIELRVPVPPATRLDLTIPGDVELRSGTSAIQREHDADANVTRMQLIPQDGLMQIVMSLNSRLKRKERTVVARSVAVNEVTEAFERLHATVSLHVLHRAMQQIQFKLPARFDVTKVSAAQLTRWETSDEGDHKVLTAFFRDDTTGTVVLNVTASGPAPATDPWVMAQLEPLEVADYAAIHGVYLDTRLETQSLKHGGLIEIDHRVLLPAIPQSVTEVDAHASPIRPIVAFYAPHQDCSLSARFAKPAAEFDLTGHTMLTVAENGPAVKGSYKITPYAETLFTVRMQSPAGWTLKTLTDVQGQDIVFDMRAEDKGSVRIMLPHGVQPGESFDIVFTAEFDSETWFDDWEQQDVAVPSFVIEGASLDIGAITIVPESDLEVRPGKTDHVFALDPGEMSRFGLSTDSQGLAYRYEGRPFEIGLTVTRSKALVTAEALSFFKLAPETLSAHHEIIFAIQDAGVREVAISLPADAPDTANVIGLNGTVIEEFHVESSEDKHQFNIRFAQKHRDTAHVSISYQQKLVDTQLADLTPPLPTVENVAYQSGMLALEGDPELDVEVTQHPREVDIGELAEATYQPGRRLLGAYGYLGLPEPVSIKATRRDAYALPSAIVQSAHFATRYDAAGTSLSAATLTVSHKTSALVVALPESSTLWSVSVNGTPAKPRRLGEDILISLPSNQAQSRVEVLYETPAHALAFLERVTVSPPGFKLASEDGATLTPIPMTDVTWSLHLPSDYRVASSHGTVSPTHLPREALAATSLLAFLHRVGGGVHFDRGIVAGCRNTLFASTKRARMMSAEGSKLVAQSMDDYSPSPSPEPAKPMAPNAGSGVVAEDAVTFFTGGELLEDVSRTLEFPQEAADENLSGLEVATVTASRISGLSSMREGKSAEWKGKKGTYWNLEGFNSLQITLDTSGRASGFNSLGESPELSVVVIGDQPLQTLSQAMALVVILLGLAFTGSPGRDRAKYVIAVLAISTLLPAIPGLRTFSGVMNWAFYAACALVPYYFVAAVARRAGRAVLPPVRRRFVRFAEAFLCASLICVATVSAEDRTLTIDVPTPVSVPADAIIIPYHADAANESILVPHKHFKALWHSAHPEAKSPAATLPQPYALSGARYDAVLEGETSLQLQGTIDITVFVDEYVEIPFLLANAVVEHADVDGRPARLRTATASLDTQRQSVSAPEAVTTLLIKGKGKHRVTLRISTPLVREGGWRVVRSTIPTATGTALDLRIPEAGTEIVLHSGAHRMTQKTDTADTRVADSLEPGGVLDVRWRPQVSEGDIEKTLSLHSAALFDIQEDRLGLIWQLDLQFRKGERDMFTLQLPEDYRIDTITGLNVRGWELREASDDQPDEVRVELLQSARESESFTVQLWRPRGVASEGREQISLPSINLPEAIRHTGSVTIRHSPLLDLRTLAVGNVRRMDLASPEQIVPLTSKAAESPLGIVPFQSFSFAEEPRGLQLEAGAPVSEMHVKEETIVRLAELDKSIETRLSLDIRNRPVHAMEIMIPAALAIDGVTAPGQYEWVAADADGEQRLTLYFSSGLQGQTAILIQGTLKADAGATRLPLPRFHVLGAKTQKGDIAVLSDPAFDVDAEGRENLRIAPLSELTPWLQKRHREHMKLGVHYDALPYAAMLTMRPRTPHVDTPETFTHVRVTDRAIEETTLLNFNVRNAGLRKIEFTLPADQRDARISVSKLRRKVVTEADEGVHVTLHLQEALLGQIRVLIEHDRLLKGAEHVVRFPSVTTGEGAQRYLSIENAGRDEVEVLSAVNANALVSSQKEWKALKTFLPGQISHAYAAEESSQAAQVTFATKARVSVVTAGARIGLAQTVLMVDGSGGYRASQTYSVDNRTEQFLEIQMPKGARLWAAIVAGEYVKPVQADEGDVVRIPLVKTTSGDLDYSVVVKYAGAIDIRRVLRGIEFPLIETRNINVELSQVELRLPRTHEWYRFDGTMNRTDDAATYAAMTLSYQNKVAQRLLQTAASGNLFEQARALSNLKEVQRTITDQCIAVQQLPVNDIAIKHLTTASEMLEQAEKIIAQDKDGRLDEQDLRDNRLALGSNYMTANSTSDRNVLVDTDGEGLGNFDIGGIVNDEQAVQNATFNGRWIDANSLQNPDIQQGQQITAQTSAINAEPDPSADQTVQTIAGVQLEAQGWLEQQDESGRVQFENQRAVKGQSRQSLRQIDNLSNLYKNTNEGREEEVTATKKTSNKGRRGQWELAQTYQKKLDKGLDGQQELNVGGTWATKVLDEVGDTSSVDFRDGVAQLIAEPSDPFGVPADQPVDQGAGGGGLPPPLGGDEFSNDMAVSDYAYAASLPSGLASLDVSLPGPDNARWATYFFTTPRGDVGIQAHATPTTTLEALWRLMAALIVTVVAWLAFRFLSQRPRRPGNALFSKIFMLICLLGLMLGFYPIASGLLLIISILGNIVRKFRPVM